MLKRSAVCSVIMCIIHVYIISCLQKLLMKCEKGVKDHQIYRDTFMAASDWLSSMVDNLNLCSDVRGDRTVVEAQLHKLQVNF